MSSSSDYYFNIFGESFRKPEGNVCFFASLLISKSVDCFNYNYHLLINLLRTVDNLLLLDLSTHYIEPVCKELSDVLFEQIDWLFEFKCLFQLYDDLVK